MAGAAGFEPTDGGIKTRCLTTWRRPKFDAVLRWQGRLDSNQRMAGSKPAALPLGDAPNTIIITGRKWQGRLDSNQRMAGSKPAALPLGDAPNLQL